MSHLFTIYKVHPNPILFDIIKFYSTESVFKIIWMVCIELWEVYINYVSPSNEGWHIVLVWFFLLSYGPEKLRWEEAEEKIRLKQYVSLRSKGRLQHTALWTCTHIPNIIDLSGKTKKLWSGQAALRRKNQTKTICHPSFEGET
jgi:hypothetical protein